MAKLLDAEKRLVAEKLSHEATERVRQPRERSARAKVKVSRAGAESR
jgi:hypothetical protein